MEFKEAQKVLSSQSVMNLCVVGSSRLLSKEHLPPGATFPHATRGESDASQMIRRLARVILLQLEDISNRRLD